MPWTFAHPAAALAFNHVSKKPRDFAALVIGCISPDIAYYLGSAALNLRTHSFVGSLKLCLPMALLLFFGLMLLRRPLCLLLPTPHRHTLWPLVNVSVQIDVKSGLRICAWILIGAWTHIAWDACTHRTGFVVQQFATLQSLWLFGWPGYQLAQHLSSAFGVLILGIAYVRYSNANRNAELYSAPIAPQSPCRAQLGVPKSIALQKCPMGSPNAHWQRAQPITTPFDDGFERWRWRLIFGSGATAILLGLPHALALANAAPIALFWRVLMFQFAVRTTSILAILIVCSAVLLYWRMRTLKFATAKKHT